MDLILIIIQFFYDFYLDNEYSVFLYKKLFNLKFVEDNEIATEKMNIINFKQEDKANYNKEINEDKNNNILQYNVSKQQEVNIQSVSEKKESKNFLQDDNINKTFQSIQSDNKLSLAVNVNNIANENDEISNRELKNELRNIKALKNKQILSVEIELKERCYLLYCWDCKSKKSNSNLKESFIKKELMIAADKNIDNKSNIFELWKYLDQFNILKKILLNENQCFMLHNINSQKEIKNKIDTERDYSQDDVMITDFYEIKNEKRKLKLLDYYRCKNKSQGIDNNIIDNLLWHYLDNEIKEYLQEEEIKMNKKIG